MEYYKEYGLKDKVAIITGAGTGIGAATAIELAKAGAKVAIFGRRAEKLADTKQKIEEYTKDVLCCSVDVRDEASVRAAVAEVVDRFGTIHLLFNNAGIETQMEPGTSLWDDYFEKLGDEDYMNFFYTHALGHYHMNNAVIPYMKENRFGRIVNNTSICGISGTYSTPGYCASKAAAIMQTKSYGIKYAMDGITVNAIAEGFVDTPLKEVTPEEYEMCAKMNPSGEVTKPVDIAKMVLFFLQEDLITTGQCLTLSTRG